MLALTRRARIPRDLRRFCRCPYGYTQSMVLVNQYQGSTTQREEKIMTELEALQQELEAHEWRFAKTMPDNPHEYTLKTSWDDPREFEWTCLMIRVRGKKRKFNGSTYIELDLP